MDFPIHIDTIRMGLSISHFKESQVEFSKLWCISVPEGFLILANSAYPDKMQHNAAFQLGLHCWPRFVFRGFQYTKG